MPLIQIKSKNENIWETHPFLDIIPEFNEFRHKEGDEHSSKILIAIWILWDSKSPFKDSSVEFDDLVNDVNTAFLEDEHFNWDNYIDIKNLYLKHCITKKESMFLYYQDEIAKLAAFLQDENNKWSMKNASEKISIISQAKILWRDYLELESQVKEEREAQRYFGGYNPSMNEQLSLDNES